MPLNQIDKAMTFLRAVALGDAELAARHVDASRFVEHDPAVANGGASLADYVAALPKDGREPQVIRVLQDEAFVVVQTQGDGPDPEVTFEAFRFDGDLIAEHWLFSTQAAPPNKSRHTQADGPTRPTRLRTPRRTSASSGTTMKPSISPAGTIRPGGGSRAIS